jgi:outer membrane protein
MPKIRILILSLLLPLVVQAQESRVLSYEEATEILLRNNFDLLLARTDADLARNENNIGNAGFLPRLDIQSSGSYASNNTRQKFSNGQEVNKNAVATRNFVGGAYLSYTLFNGFRAYATKRRLELLQEQGELNFSIQVENALEQLTLLYYQIVRQEQYIRGLQTALDVADARLALAEKKKAVGNGSNVEVLQAKLDRNGIKSGLIAQRSQLKQFHRSLALLLQADSLGSFQVDTQFRFEPMQSFESLKEKIEQLNPGLLFADKSLQIDREMLREIRAERYPRLDINSQYQFNRNQNAAGFSLFNQNLGFATGFTLSWNVFNGYRNRTRLKSAELSQTANRLRREKLSATLHAEAFNAYAQWVADRKALALEEENIALAEQSLFIMLERMKIGLGNYLETKESQQAYQEAVTRLVNARYALKSSETRLRRISGVFIRP